MIHWVIQETNYQNDFNVAQRLSYLLAELGHEVITFQYIPFGGTDWSFLPKDGHAVYFGGWNALADIRRRGIQTPEPFAWCDFEKFKCRTYYRELGDYVVQKQPRFLKLGQLTGETFGDQERLFIRPDDNEKSFVGQLVDKDLCFAFVKNLADYGQLDEFLTDGDLDIVASLPQRIKCEWRMILVDGKVASGSQYKEGQAIEIVAGYPEGVKDFAEAVAKRWSPHPVFIVDVCETDAGYKVMEIGPFNYAGLYLSDLTAVANAVNNYVERTYA